MNKHADITGQTVFGLRVVYRLLKEEERAGPNREWVYQGRIEDRELQLWDINGRWREDGTPHPFDLAITQSQGTAA